MGRFYEEIQQGHFDWIKKQHVFWVATAPLSDKGHVNVSPKGTADCFHVVNSKQVWYEDLTGSGVETISHVKENGRITIMFSAFEGPPRILRLFGVGTVHEYGSPEYNRLIAPTTRRPGSRAVIYINVYQVGASCGFSVPLYDFVMQRTQLDRLANKIEQVDKSLAAARDQPCLDQRDDRALIADAGDEKKANPPSLFTISMGEYWLAENMHSLDGLPGLATAPAAMQSTAPQGHFDENTPRPKMYRNIRNVDVDITRISKWFVSGFTLGLVTMFVVGRLVG